LAVPLNVFTCLIWLKPSLVRWILINHRRLLLLHHLNIIDEIDGMCISTIKSWKCLLTYTRDLYIATYSLLKYLLLAPILRLPFQIDSNNHPLWHWSIGLVLISILKTMKKHRRITQSQKKNNKLDGTYKI